MTILRVPVHGPHWNPAGDYFWDNSLNLHSLVRDGPGLLVTTDRITV